MTGNQADADQTDPFRLEDPFIGFNEVKAEWVGLKSWTYRTTLTRPNVPLSAKVILVFDGLDTFAHVKLGGRTILESDNMFLPHRVDITEVIKSKASHDLQIEFESAFLKARGIKDQHPEHKFICFNGDSARLAVRKAQYHWGWDWGPVLMCAGIWRPARLEIYTIRIFDLKVDISISDDHKLATIHATAEIEGHDGSPAHLFADFNISLDGKTISSGCVKLGQHGKASTHLEVPNPELWMPHGYGKQTLYTVSVTAVSDGMPLHTESRRVGLRKIRRSQDNDSHGTSFYFRVNNVDIFCGGSCWIPTDSFLTNVTPERYRAWIELMVPANQKMIR